MSAAISIAPEKDVRPITRELLLALMGPDVDEEELKICENEAMAKFYGDRGVTPHSKDVHKYMDGLALKFEVHGLFDLCTSFKRNIECFTSEYRKFTVEHPDAANFPPCLTLEGCEWRILYFLHLMSWNPVQKEIRRLKAALDNSELNTQPPPIKENATESDTFDWGAHLLEGLPIWDAPLESDSDASHLSDSDDPNETSNLGRVDYSNVSQDDETGHSSLALGLSLLNQTAEGPHSVNDLLVWMKQAMDAGAKLDCSLQSPWWIHADKPLRMTLEPTVEVLSEYTLIRELLWLLTAPACETHCFKIQDKLYVPRDEIAIKGLYQGTLWEFMNDMCAYINMVKEIEEFSLSLKGLNECQCSKTYSAYNAALNSFLRVFKSEVKDVELKVHKQNSITTLVFVCGALKPWLDNLRFLSTVHRKATANWKAFPKWSMAVRLLSVWLEAAMAITSKEHVTIAFNVFLKSFRPYFRIIDQWFRLGRLDDPSEEFIVCRQPWQYGVAPSFEKMWALGFIVRPFQQYVTCDVLPPTVLQLIMTAGKSIDVIQSIGKISAVQPDGAHPVVEEAYLQFLYGLKISLACHERRIYTSRSMGVLTLPPANEHRFTAAIKALDHPDNTIREQVDSVYPDCYKDIYEKIASFTSETFLPIGQVLGAEEMSVLKPRADVISRTLKDILINDYLLHVRLHMLRTLFFVDHPHYVEVFKVLFTCRRPEDHSTNNCTIQMGIRDILGEVSQIFNTLHYKLVINDKFYSDENIISAMKFITYEYPVEWPVSIIINATHVDLYNDIFHFVLPLKWVLYDVSHLPIRLDYNDKQSVIAKSRFLRYQALRFWLMSSLGGLNTFFLNYILGSYTKEMRISMCRATNFEMVAEAHNVYLDRINKLCSCHGSRLKLFITQLVELASCFAVTWHIRSCNMMDSKLADMENFYSTLHQQIIRELNALVARFPSQSEKLDIYEELYCTFNQNRLPDFGKQNTS